MSEDTRTGFLYIILGAITLMIGAWSRLEYKERQAIQRGYALHCPVTGDFAWKGECDD